MWFLNRNVLLTKDNLAKRKWQGCTKCSFCGCEEIVEHLFISCPFAQLIWRVVFCSYNIPPPSNISNMFGNWLNGVDKRTNARIHIGLGLFGIVEIIWFFTEQKTFMSCRLST